MPRIEDINDQHGNFYRRSFVCPGCNDTHEVDGKWTFNGDYEKPTLRASIKVRGVHIPDDNYPTVGTPSVCHSYVTDGKIQFLGDCTHKLVGQTVELPELPDA